MKKEKAKLSGKLSSARLREGWFVFQNFSRKNSEKQTHMSVYEKALNERKCH